MAITDLHNMMAEDFLGFNVIKLHDTSVVINGNDFSSFLYDYFKLPRSYGGEYLAFIIRLEEVLENLKQCHLDCRFIFNSDAERIGLQISSELRSSYSMIKILEQNHSGQQIKYLKNVPLLSLDNEFATALENAGFYVLKSPFPGTWSSASLASYLKCPLLGSSPEYFLMPDVNFCPLSFTNFNPVALENNSGSDNQCMLISHQFIPSLSSLSQVRVNSRPLLGLLYGSNSVPNIKLPSCVQRNLKGNISLKYKFVRWTSLLCWFVRSGLQTTKLVHEVLKSYSKPERGKVLQLLTESLTIYFPDLKLGKKLSNLTKSLLMKELALSESSSSCFIGFPNGPQSPTEYTLWNQRLSKILGKNPDKFVCGFNFIAKWPVNLIQLYCNHQLAPHILKPLYCQGGVVLPVTLENVTADSSVYDASLFLRVMHYRLISGLEYNLEQKHKLVGLTPQVTEHVRKGNKMVSNYIIIEPFILNSSSDNLVSILKEVFGFSISDYIMEPDWLLSLSIVLAIWYKSVVKHGLLSCCFSYSSFGLAVAAIAVANVINTEQRDLKLYQHYSTLINFMKKRLKNSASHNYDKYNIDVVHHFNVVQLITNYFKSLVTLINGLLTPNHISEQLSFLPTWIYFPSGYLVYWLSLELESNPAENRFYLCQRFWLPRLFHVQQYNLAAISKLKSIVTLFELLINRTSEITSLPKAFPDVMYETCDTVYSEDILSNNYQQAPEDTLSKITSRCHDDSSIKSFAIPNQNNMNRFIDIKSTENNCSTNPTEINFSNFQLNKNVNPKKFNSLNDLSHNFTSKRLNFKQPCKFKSKLSRHEGSQSYANRLLARLEAEQNQ